MKKNLVITTFVMVCMIATLIMGISAPFKAAAAPLVQEEAVPTIASDALDYSPGGTVTLTGANWQGDTTVHVVVDDTLGKTWQHVADLTVSDDGTIVDTFTLSLNFISDYNVTATGNDTQRVATTTFTDAANIDFTQCENNHSGSGTVPSNCFWTTGNLDGQHNLYTEGDAVAQRLFHQIDTAGTHTMRFEYDFSKGSVYAYDFITSPDASQGSLLNACANLPGFVSASTCSSLLSGKLLAPIPSDLFDAVAARENPPGAGARNVWVGGVTSASVSIVGHVPSTACFQNCGDSTVLFDVTFTTASNNQIVAVWFAGHLAEALDPPGNAIGWGTTGCGKNGTDACGASSVSGSPFHIGYNSLDGGSVGKRDNQVSIGAVVPPGRIIIEKQTNPDGSTQQFEFAPSYAANFFLTDGQQNDSGSLLPGTYSVAEVNLPAGWSLTSTVCSDGSAVSAISLQAGEIVTCVFTDTFTANDLTVTKTATPSFTRTYTWDIAKDVDKTEVDIADGGTATFNYTVNVTHDSGSDSGWAVNGTITVSNPNAYSVSGVSVTDAIDDPNASCTVSGGSSTIAANSSATFNYTCTYSAAPAESSQTNTATATWTPFGSPNTSASGTASVDWSSVTPTLTDESVTVTDTLGGNLGTVSYTDPSPTTFTYSHDFQGVGGTCTDYDNTATFTTNTSGTTGSASATVKVCVGLDLTVEKTATPSFTRTFTWDIIKDVDKTKINIADGGTATFNYTVNVTHDSGTDSGWAVNGTITVSNPNDWEDIVADVTDALDTGACMVTGGTNVTVPKSGSVTLDYSCDPASANATTNTATATWDKDSYFTPDGSATGSATFAFTTPTTIVDGSVDVTDTLGGSLGTVSYTDPSPTPFTYSHDFQGVGGTCTDYDNTVTFTTNTSGTTGSASQTVKVCVGLDLTVSKTATPSFARTFTWDISKDVDKTEIDITDGGTATFHYTVNVTHDDGTDSAWMVKGTITISNPNDWEAIDANVSDAVDNGGSCSLDNPAQATVTVPANGSVNVDYTCTFSSGASGTNTATATWDKDAYFTPSGSASGSVPFAFTTPTTIVDGSVTVTDTLGGSLGTVSYTDPSPTTFTYSHDFQGDPGGTCTNHDNTTTFITNDNGTTGSASQTVKVCVGLDLTVSKTATPFFTRTYLWEIFKNVDRTHVTQVSGNVTFNYTVQVNQTGFTDSDWKVTGTITISNPNDWEDIDANVSDAVDNGGSCTVDSASVTVPASGSVDVGYTCTFSSGASGTNTATATWDKDVYFTPNGSASGSASFAFTTPTNTVNKTITVTDTFNSVTQTLGTVTATDSAPFASATFTYSYTVPVPDAACKSYTNTATIVETGQSASQTVTVCKPSLITDTMLCTLTNDQFKLIFTPDQGNGWKLNASNPGQFYYNIFYSGAGDVNITVTLPYPFVTQGAVPIHAYSDVDVNTTDGTTCLTPVDPLPNPEQTYVTLATYDGAGKPPLYDFSKTATVTIHVPATPSGFAYINIHLDYGLKGTTGYAKDGNNNAVRVNTSTVLIPDLQSYNFSDTAGGTATITSTNSFKKDPGIGGLVLNSNDDPKKNVQVRIYDSKNKLLATVYTDDDGWYMWQYKYTGKPATFTVKLPAYNLSQSVTLKSNGYLVVNFTVP